MKSSKQQLKLSQFNNLLQQAKIIDLTYPLSALVWMPYGHKILNLTEKFLTELFEKFAYERYVFPFLVSSSEFNHINKRIAFFKKGVFEITDSVILRPSGESAIYPMFRRWIKNEGDLPIKAFQIGSMFRKGSTRGFMKQNENNFFIEAHSAFGSKKEAEREFTNSNKLVEEYLKWLAIPTLQTIRPPWTNKPVAEKQYAFDALLPIGETALLNVTYSQMQIFSKAFNISFKKKDGGKDYTYQIEFGFSQRSILTSIWLLSKQDNLFLLPTYSPIQIVIIQIDPFNAELSKYIKKVAELLKSANIRVSIDKDKKQLFKRFIKHEQAGVPIRFEIGTKELKDMSVKIVRQDNNNSFDCVFNNISKTINKLFQDIVSESYLKNKKVLIKNIILCEEKKRISTIIKSGKIAKLYLCYCEKCVKELEKDVGCGEVIGFKNKKGTSVGECAFCCKATTKIAYFARRV